MAISERRWDPKRRGQRREKRLLARAPNPPGPSVEEPAGEEEKKKAG